MLSNEEIELRLKNTQDVFYVKVEGDGYQYQVTVVSDLFLNCSLLARQQWVYAQLNDFITAGRLHAIRMNTWTKDEWEKQNG
jgi:acid stress-induced BolA-like protein IbaG/YrbA